MFSRDSTECCHLHLCWRIALAAHVDYMEEYSECECDAKEVDERVGCGGTDITTIHENRHICVRAWVRNTHSINNLVQHPKRISWILLLFDDDDDARCEGGRLSNAIVRHAICKTRNQKMMEGNIRRSECNFVCRWICRWQNSRDNTMAAIAGHSGAEMIKRLMTERNNEFAKIMRAKQMCDVYRRVLCRWYEVYSFIVHLHDGCCWLCVDRALAKKWI